MYSGAIPRGVVKAIARAGALDSRSDVRLSWNESEGESFEYRESNTMFARGFILALIAVVVVCPLRCRNGHCETCGPAVHGAAPPCTTAAAEAGCCGRIPLQAGPVGTSCPPSDRAAFPPADQDSERTGCQGVCGGAVLKRSSGVPTPVELALLSIVDAGVDWNSPSAMNRPPGWSVWVFGSAMSPGRFLRTLHRSLLL